MKKLLLTSAAGALLFSGGLAGIGAVQADQANDQTSADQVSSENNKASSNLQKYTEYEALEEHVDDVEAYQVKVAADNADKRVIILSDDSNQKQYKSVFVKDTERLKIIDQDNGQVFNDVLKNVNKPEADDEDDAKEDDNESSDEESDEVDDYPEFDTLENEVNADDDQAQIIEDNDNKRVMTVQEEDGQNEYKSVFIKNENRLKIIDQDNGQVFNEVLKNVNKPEADDEDENESSDEESGEVDDYPEFDTLENEVNADDDQAQIIEDNDNKRVMTVQEEDSQNEYESVFIKDENRLKIIDQDKGQIFNNIIK